MEEKELNNTEKENQKITNEEVKKSESANSQEKIDVNNQAQRDENQKEEDLREKISDETKGEEINEMEKLQNEIERLKEEVEQWKDKFVRKMAEFENYKKRVQQDQIQLINFANEKLIKDLLPVVDDFERTLTFSKEELRNNSVLQGVEMVYNKFMKILSDYGLKKIDALHKPFDFNYHEALLQVPKEDVEPLTVIEEVEKGYLLNDKVIRHSKVIVSGEVNLESNPSDNQNNNEEVK